MGRVIDYNPLKFSAQEGAYALCISSNTHTGKPGPIQNADKSQDRPKNQQFLFFHIVTFGDMKIDLKKTQTIILFL